MLFKYLMINKNNIKQWQSKLSLLVLKTFFQEFDKDNLIVMIIILPKTVNCISVDKCTTVDHQKIFLTKLFR